MNVGEANDVNQLLSYLAGRRASDYTTDPPPAPGEGWDAAERLADHAHKATYAGWSGERFRKAMLGGSAGLSPAEAEAEMLVGFRGCPSGYRGELHHLLATAFETSAGDCDHGEQACSDCLAAIALRTLVEGRAR